MTAPAGLSYAGRLYASSGSGQGDDVKEDHFVYLPVGAILDRTYQQVGGLPTSGGGAQSPLASGDIPHGFYVECGGSDTHGKRWAVLKPYSGEPVLTAIDFNDDNTVRQWKFTLGLYADTGNQMGNGGANTEVDVWYKIRSA